MIYIFNKDKIVSYMVVLFIVASIFTFSTVRVPNDIELTKVSTNVVENNELNNNIVNYYK